MDFMADEGPREILRSWMPSSTGLSGGSQANAPFSRRKRKSGADDGDVLAAISTTLKKSRITISPGELRLSKDLEDCTDLLDDDQRRTMEAHSHSHGAAATRCAGASQAVASASAATPSPASEPGVSDGGFDRSSAHPFFFHI